MSPHTDEQQKYLEHKNRVANEQKPVSRNVAIALMTVIIVAGCLTMLLIMYLIMNNGRL